MTEAVNDSQDLLLKKIAARLHMKDIALLRRALTHSSFSNENGFIQDNERLEFLGDAILDFIVGDWLYRNRPEMDEGNMTLVRSLLVRNEQLAQFAREIRLGQALHIGKGEELNGGRERTSLLGSAFEALVGALYLDQGIQAVRQFIIPFIENASQIDAIDPEEVDPKSAFQNWAQKKHLGTPVYQIIGASGPDHKKTFEAAVLINGQEYGRGKGRNKHQAEENAARDALQNTK